MNTYKAEMSIIEDLFDATLCAQFAFMRKDGLSLRAFITLYLPIGLDYFVSAEDCNKILGAKENLVGVKDALTRAPRVETSHCR